VISDKGGKGEMYCVLRAVWCWGLGGGENGFRCEKCGYVLDLRKRKKKEN